MKLKKSQIKQLVKEVIETATEINAANGEGSWSVEGDSEVIVEEYKTSDGRLMGFKVSIDGEWDDGAFDYEYGSIKGTHRSEPQFSIQNAYITEVFDEVTNKPVWRFARGGQSLKDFDPQLENDLVGYWEGIKDEVEQYINENPPDSSSEFDYDDEDR